GPPAVSTSARRAPSRRPRSSEFEQQRCKALRRPPLPAGERVGVTGVTHNVEIRPPSPRASPRWGEGARAARAANHCNVGAAAGAVRTAFDRDRRAVDRRRQDRRAPAEISETGWLRRPDLSDQSGARERARRALLAFPWRPARDARSRP